MEWASNIVFEDVYSKSVTKNNEYLFGSINDLLTVSLSIEWFLSIGCLLSFFSSFHCSGSEKVGEGYPSVVYTNMMVVARWGLVFDSKRCVDKNEYDQVTKNYRAVVYAFLHASIDTYNTPTWATIRHIEDPPFFLLFFIKINIVIIRSERIL